MSRIVDIAAIEKRRREIVEEIDRLKREMEELDMALRVISRFEAKDVEESAPEPVAAKLGPVRPDGIPTNYDMAEVILRDAVNAGRRGLTAAEMVEEIGRRWWPGVQGPQILPIMYQFAKRGRLLKGEDGFFSIPLKEEAPSAATEGASKPEVNEGSNLQDLMSKPRV